MLVYLLMLTAEWLLCNSKLQSHSTALWCEYCSRPIHIRCIPFDKAEYQDVVKINHGWPCTQCNNALFPFNSIDDEYEFVEALYEFINGSNIDHTVLKEKVFNPLLLNDKTTIPLFEIFYNEISSIYVDNSNYYFEDQVSKKFSKTDYKDILYSTWKYKKFARSSYWMANLSGQHWRAFYFDWFDWNLAQLK